MIDGPLIDGRPSSSSSIFSGLSDDAPKARASLSGAGRRASSDLPDGHWQGSPHPHPHAHPYGRYERTSYGGSGRASLLSSGAGAHPSTPTDATGTGTGSGDADSVLYLSPNLPQQLNHEELASLCAHLQGKVAQQQAALHAARQALHTALHAPPDASASGVGALVAARLHSALSGVGGSIGLSSLQATALSALHALQTRIDGMASFCLAEPSPLAPLPHDATLLQRVVRTVHTWLRTALRYVAAIRTRFPVQAGVVALVVALLIGRLGMQWLRRTRQGRASGGGGGGTTGAGGVSALGALLPVLHALQSAVSGARDSQRDGSARARG